MIKLLIKGKDQIVSNKEGLRRLRKSNPKEKFKIAKCKATGKNVIMQFDKGYTSGNGHPNWLCLHD